MTAAMVLCAGYGTRLRPLTAELPKALVPVGDRPALSHVLGALADAGMHRVVVNAHHRADDLSMWSRAAPHGAEIVLVREEAILGTAGGVANATGALGAGPVLVHNCDIIAPDLSLAAVVAAFERADAEILWVVAPRPPGQGTVGLGAQGDVVRVRGRTFGDERAGADYLGVQVIGASARRKLPTAGCLIGDFCLPLLERGGRMATMAFSSTWHDIGDAASLLRANLSWLDRHGLDAWCAPDASVSETVKLDRSLVGARARVEGTGKLTGSVVLPRAHVCAPQDGVLVCTAGTLR